MVVLAGVAGTVHEHTHIQVTSGIKPEVSAYKTLLVTEPSQGPVLRINSPSLFKFLYPLFMGYREPGLA